MAADSLPGCLSRRKNGWKRLIVLLHGSARLRGEAGHLSFQTGQTRFINLWNNGLRNKSSVKTNLSVLTKTQT